MSPLDPLVQEALEEAHASAPSDVIVYHTIEVMHPTFLEPIRVVRHPVVGEHPEIFKLRLESTAPINAGEVVDFIGAPFELVLPEQNSDVTGTFTFRVDGINDEMDQYMQVAAVSGEILLMNYREFVKGHELDGPGSVWRDIQLKNPRVEGLSFLIDGAILDWMDKPYGELYRAIDYPALVSGR